MLLPLPDGPMIAAASPGASDNDTSDSTASGPRGVGYSLLRWETFEHAVTGPAAGRRVRSACGEREHRS